MFQVKMVSGQIYLLDQSFANSLPSFKKGSDQQDSSRYFTTGQKIVILLTGGNRHGNAGKEDQR
jgi:hypothetical protein